MSKSIASIVGTWAGLMMLVVASVALGDETLRIVVVSHGQASDPFWSVVKNGVDHAGKEARVEVSYLAPETFDMIRMARMIEAAVASHPSGLVVSIPDSDALGDAIAEAIGSGVPVISMNSGGDAGRSLGALLHIGQSEYEAGRRAGERLKNIGIERAACITHEVGNAALDRRCEGFTAGMGGRVKVVATSLDPTEIEKAVAAHLMRYSDTQAILTLTTTPADAALAAIEAEGLVGRVQLATFDLSPSVLKALADECILFAIDQQPFLQGYLPVMLLAMRHRFGLLPASDVETGPKFVTPKDAARVIGLSAQGIR